MKKSVLIGMTALALVACGKKTPPAEIPPATTEQPANPPGTATDDSVDLVELPAMQADLIAKAGSDTVYFGTDEYSLDAQSQATLAAQARWMMANPSVRASIEGHADERGTREYNLALGERRANAAKEFLIAQGVPAGRLTTISWGKERPVAVGSNEEAWAQNRRAVTVVVR
ncbi:MAG TPA: peptidoglycan-associated lipoprotein Pal [Sphingomicrobium sp.]|nr:peptidoglycan-associated lipoprotein Pal [Sphingomicrobium sp.]